MPGVYWSFVDFSDSVLVLIFCYTVCFVTKCSGMLGNHPIAVSMLRHVGEGDIEMSDIGSIILMTIVAPV